ncbi:alpha/beta hydrolase [Actinokineospora sp.]|uniref:alpha/beta hydrolase n=1 Tax=Actinokineospora sp. TaxID=1872133 RepID=UPI004037946B
MPIAEPSAALGLWPRVKALSGWPETDETSMQALATAWSTAGTSFAQAGRFNVGAVAASWADSVAVAFQDRARTNLDQATRSAETMTQLADRATYFAGEVTQVKTGIRTLIEANLGIFASTSLLPAGVSAVAQEVFVTQLAGMVNQLMSDAAGRVAGLGGAVAAVPPPPPEGAPPEQNAAYWNSLTEEQRQQLIRENPDLVGNRDGFSAVHRDQANRILLDREQARLTGEIDRLNRLRAIPGVGTQIAELERQRGRLDALEQRLDAPAGRGPDDRYFLLGLDPRGDGRAIVAAGNPDTAANVATFIPGADTSLDSVLGSVDRADNLRAAAERSGSPSTSVITWLDYDSPPLALAPFASGYADDARRDLDSFQHGLRASHQGAPSHNTVVGHSYGSLVAGAAARDEVLPVDEFVSAGSIGLGVDHADQLNLPPGHVWVTETDGDWIADNLVNHGRDPSNEEFGARQFESDTPVSLPGDDPHSQYFDNHPENPALNNIGDIIAGREPRAG